MKLAIVALYPGRLVDLLNRPGVKERKRKGGSWTQVPCDLVTADTTTKAKPTHVPPGVPDPLFRAQLELTKAEDGGKIVAVVLPDGSAGGDPEQHVLAPIYNNGRRVLFEFQKADILVVTSDGLAELRLVAVNPLTGEVGTKTKYLFHTQFVKLMTRCQSHLAGAIDLFPALDRATSRFKNISVPAGPANFAPRPADGFGDAKASQRGGSPAK